MNLTLRIWRQQIADAPGRFADYQVKNVTPDMSFLEMLDALNEDLLSREEFPQLESSPDSPAMSTGPVTVEFLSAWPLVFLAASETALCLSADVRLVNFHDAA